MKYLDYVRSENFTTCNEAKLKEVKNWVSTTLQAYIKKNGENQTEIEHILDFMMNGPSPKRLQKMSYIQAHTAAEAWNKRLIKKGMDIIEGPGDTETIKEFENGFRFIKLVGEDAFKREGSLMRHCVASYYGKSGCEVYSLRDENNNPHCTIEVEINNEGDSTYIQQIKGKGNGSVAPKYIGGIIKILECFNQEVRSSEMENLGYIEVSKELLTKMKKDLDIKTFNYKGRQYVYMY